MQSDMATMQTPGRRAVTFQTPSRQVNKSFEQTMAAKCWTESEARADKTRAEARATYIAYINAVGSDLSALAEFIQKADETITARMSAAAKVMDTGPGQSTFQTVYNTVRRTLETMFKQDKLGVFVWKLLLPQRTGVKAGNFELAVAAMWASVRASTLRGMGLPVFTSGSDATVQYVVLGEERMCVPVKTSFDGDLSGVDLANTEASFNAHNTYSYICEVTAALTQSLTQTLMGAANLPHTPLTASRPLAFQTPKTPPSRRNQFT